MKSNATPELSQKWWSTNKAKTLKPTGLGKLLKDFEVAEDQMDWDKALKALAGVKKKIPSVIKACNETLHKDTLAALKKYAKVIEAKEADLTARKQDSATRAVAASAPKQKVGKQVVLWQRDVGALALKTYKPNFLEAMHGFEFKLKLNDDILDVLEAEKDLVTPQQMVDDCNERSDALIAKLVALMRKIEAAADKEADSVKRQKIYALFELQTRAELKKAKADFADIPQTRWNAYTKRKQQFRDYQIKTGVELTIGVLSVAGGALGVAGAAATGGASLALGIVGLVRGVTALASKVKDIAISANTVEKTLESDLETLKARYHTAVGAAQNMQGVSEVSASVLKGILGEDTPFLATLPKCDRNFELLQNKVAGLEVGGRDLSGQIEKGLKACAKLEQILKATSGANARKQFDTLRKGREALDKALDACSDMMSDATRVSKNAPKLEQLLTALKGTNPKYADIFEKAFPVVVNLALTGANAADGFKGAESALEHANTSLSLFNDLLGEIEKQVDA